MSSQPSVSFQVEKIIDVITVEGNVKNFKVQWAPTWVSSLNLVGCEKLIREYLNQRLDEYRCRDGVFAFPLDVNRNIEGIAVLKENSDSICQETLPQVFERSALSISRNDREEECRNGDGHLQDQGLADDMEEGEETEEETEHTLRKKTKSLSDIPDSVYNSNSTFDISDPDLKGNASNSIFESSQNDPQEHVTSTTNNDPQQGLDDSILQSPIYKNNLVNDFEDCVVDKESFCENDLDTIEHNDPTEIISNGPLKVLQSENSLFGEEFHQEPGVAENVALQTDLLSSVGENDLETTEGSFREPDSNTIENIKPQEDSEKSIQFDPLKVFDGKTFANDQYGDDVMPDEVNKVKHINSPELKTTSIQITLPKSLEGKNSLCTNEDSYQEGNHNATLNIVQPSLSRCAEVLNENGFVTSEHMEPEQPNTKFIKLDPLKVSKIQSFLSVKKDTQQKGEFNLTKDLLRTTDRAEYRLTYDSDFSNGLHRVSEKDVAVEYQGLQENEVKSIQYETPMVLEDLSSLSINEDFNQDVEQNVTKDVIDSGCNSNLSNNLQSSVIDNEESFEIELGTVESSKSQKDIIRYNKTAGFIEEPNSLSANDSTQGADEQDEIITAETSTNGNGNLLKVLEVSLDEVELAESIKEEEAINSVYQDPSTAFERGSFLTVINHSHHEINQTVVEGTDSQTELSDLESIYKNSSNVERNMQNMQDLLLLDIETPIDVAVSNFSNFQESMPDLVHSIESQEVSISICQNSSSNTNTREKSSLDKSVRNSKRVKRAKGAYNSGFPERRIKIKRKEFKTNCRQPIPTRIGNPQFDGQTIGNAERCGSDCAESMPSINVQNMSVEGKYKCVDCGITFVSEINYLKHECYSCASCKLTFYDKSVFDKHKSLHQTHEITKENEKELEDLVCRDCGISLIKSGRFHKHICFRCTYCNMVFTKRTLFHKHSCTNEESYKTSSESKPEIDKNSNEIGHETNEGNSKPNDETGKSNIQTKLETDKRGNKIKLETEKSVKKREIYKRSSKVKHKTEKSNSKTNKVRINTCKVCKQMFTGRNKLERHMLTHTDSDQRKYQCEICMKKFYRKANLNAHMLIHKGKRDHSCEICAKKFNRKDHLKRHMSTH